MFSSSAARNYAKGLVAAAQGSQDPDQLATTLAEFGRIVSENRELGRALGNTALPLAKRVAVARAVLKAGGAPPVIESFVAVLLENGHYAGLPAIIAAVKKAAAEASGVVRAELRTAHPATAEEIRSIGAALGTALGRKVEIQASVDPALIGGFVARAGDLVFDGSIARQLERMRVELTRG